MQRYTHGTETRAVQEENQVVVLLLGKQEARGAEHFEEVHELVRGNE